ncbi:hypothetical protein [Acidovorax facilis]|uniref:hypothetical protein n=1 Tax=Acidovorax facilis TaxID=12917 RepID=UPI003D654E08
MSRKPGAIQIERQQVELTSAYEAIAQLRADVQAARSKTNSAAPVAVPSASATTAASATAHSPSIPETNVSKAYKELLTTKEGLAVQLDKAVQTIVRLREEVNAERQNSAQARNERHAIQTDLEKFRTIQREISAENASSRTAAKPWYKLW